MGRNEEKHHWINRTLQICDTRGVRDIEAISNILKNEPRAKVRRINGRALLNIDDVKQFSELLAVEYPQLIYFLANYKTGRPTPSKFPDELEINLYSDLHAATTATLEVERIRPAYNGPYFNRPAVFGRLPWPDEQVCKNPEELIGGREFPDDYFDLASQHRRLGRWFMFWYGTKGYVHPRVPLSPNAEWVLDRIRQPDTAYLPFDLLNAEQSTFSTSYDLADPDVAAFAKRAHALWRRVSTSRVAHYDPASGDIVHPENWDGKFTWNIGKRALAGALERPRRYAGFAPRAAPDGGRLLLGPPARKAKANR